MPPFSSYFDWKDYYRSADIGETKIDTNKKVLEFIFSFPTTMRDYFSNGYCYWFAVILAERYSYLRPRIWYNTVENHFVTEIENVIYDSNGVVCAEEPYDVFYTWKDYQKVDPRHAARITAQCINFDYKEEEYEELHPYGFN